jgi:preprotein translocase SecE subunit
MKPTIKTPGKTPTRPPSGTKSAATTTSVRARNNANAQTFVKSVVAEMRRVTWPTREEWVTATLLTIGLVLVVGIYTAAADHLFGWVIGLVTGNTAR